MNRTRVVLFVLVVGAVVSAALLYGRASNPADAAAADNAPVHGNFSLEQARGASSFELYNAGDAVAGRKLSAVERRDDEANYVSFIYGDCVASGEQGCPLPLEIQVWPACVRNLSLYDRPNALAAALAPHPSLTLARGVPAGVLDEGRQLEIQTGTSTIVIFGETRALVNVAAAALRGVNNAGRVGVDLPPPAKGAVEGTLVCA